MYSQDSGIQNAPIGMAYVPMQRPGKRYTNDVAIIRGTVFPELDLPFRDFVITVKLPRTPLHEVMEHDFAGFDLALFLDTHPDDGAAREYYRQCAQKSAEARRAYEAQGRFLTKSGAYSKNGSWIADPWPWD